MNRAKVVALLKLAIGFSESTSRLGDRLSIQ
jgi:hypothetical protein